MCENCIKHGEGKKWFLQAKNYSNDLLGDLTRRKYIKDFFAGQARLVGKKDPMQRLQLVPLLFRPAVNAIIKHRLSRDHYGQVVNANEAREIIGMVSKVVRLPCVCRRITVRQEKRYCFGLTLQPDSLGALNLIDVSYWEGPNSGGLEVLTRREALELLADFEEEGLIHSVWTFKTPFIAGLCNCSALECRAMLGNLSYNLEVLHPGETIVLLDASSCINCGACAERCQFDAITYDRNVGLVSLDSGKCYGCGLCVSVCPTDSLKLVSRWPLAKLASHEQQ